MASNSSQGQEGTAERLDRVGPQRHYWGNSGYLYPRCPIRSDFFLKPRLPPTSGSGLPLSAAGPCLHWEAALQLRAESSRGGLRTSGWSGPEAALVGTETLIRECEEDRIWPGWHRNGRHEGIPGLSSALRRVGHGRSGPVPCSWFSFLPPGVEGSLDGCIPGEITRRCPGATISDGLIPWALRDSSPERFPPKPLLYLLCV